MKRSVLMFIALFVLVFAAPGCRAGGQAHQPLFGGGLQQAGAPQTMQQLGRNFGSRLTNGVMNRGVNYLINGAISAF